MTDQDRDQLKASLKAAEGLRLAPYLDSGGTLTIGYGHNLRLPITKAEAERYLSSDLERAENDARRDLWCFDSLDPVRQRALVEMTFQLGIRGVLKFRRMIAALNANDYAGAAREMLESVWAQQTPTRVQRLAAMMRTGKDHVP